MKTTLPTLLLTLVVGCASDQGHSHGGDEHSHGGDEHSHGGDEHGHGGDEHGHGGDDHGHGHDSELPAQSVTAWTDKSELFMEYNPFVVGSESRFLAHLTVLKGFAALKEGTVTVTVTMKDGAKTSATAKAPARPGIFIPVITPAAPGACTLTVDVNGPGGTDRIDAGPCVVFPDAAAARSGLPGDEDAGGAISFLKEQQWVIDFGTAPIETRELQGGVRVNAEIRAAPDREARLTAGTDGRLVLAKPVPILGASVKKKQLLASIQPTASATGNFGALKADVDAADAEHTAAVAQRDRLGRLVASDAVPKRRLEDAEAAVKVARARLNAARTRRASYSASASGSATATAGAFRVRAPIDGTLVEVRATSGETVKAGDLLFTVIDLDRVWVTGRVFEADLPKLDSATTGWFQVEGRDDVFELTEATGQLVTVGSVIDPKTRTVPIVFAVDNTARVLRIGQFATLTVATGKKVSVPAIPESALVQEGGQWVAYVQTEGESFERRVVRTGIRSRGWVEVQSGVSAGEHVVTTGAYDVKLAASAGGAPAHGHSH